MTDQALAGDFLRAAFDHLRAAASGARAAAGPDELSTIMCAVRDLAQALTRHLDDILPASDIAAGDTHLLGGRARAAAEASHSLSRAAAALSQAEGRERLPSSGAWHPARDIAAATESLTAARDLLQTHFAPGPGGLSKIWISEWSPVIASPSGRRALMAEVSACTRQAAQIAVRAARAAGGHSRTAPARSLLEGACQHLWAAEEAIHSAELRDPAEIADRELLHAVPVYRMPERVEHAGRQTVPQLCAAVITTAERVRQATWRQALSAVRPELAPAPGVVSLRRCAASSTVISYTSGVLLETLASRAIQLGLPDFARSLAQPIDAVSAANIGWMATAQALGQVRGDSPDVVSMPVAAAGDLAAWIGRLTYGDPDWTPARGPCRDLRSPENLAADSRQLAQVTAAVHHATATLSRLAVSEAAQASGCASAGRLYSAAPSSEPERRRVARAHVWQLLEAGRTHEEIAEQAGLGVATIRSLAKNADHRVTDVTIARILRIPVKRRLAPADAAFPYARASRGRIEAVRQGYEAASEGSEGLAASMDTAARQACAPSRLLAAVRTASATPRLALPAQTMLGPGEELLASVMPTMRTLRQAGSSGPDVMARAAELDADDGLTASLEQGWLGQ
jgi:hypothetical protein